MLEQQKQYQDILEKQEEERNKYILYKMEWDKEFSSEDTLMGDDMGG